jgi:hypothetical protein
MRQICVSRYWGEAALLNRLPRRTGWTGGGNQPQAHQQRRRHNAEHSEPAVGAEERRQSSAGDGRVHAFVIGNWAVHYCRSVERLVAA